MVKKKSVFAYLNLYFVEFLAFDHVHLLMSGENTPMQTSEFRIYLIFNTLSHLLQPLKLILVGR